MTTDQLEQTWLAGMCDDYAGDVDYRGYAYRVDRWIVETDDRSFAPHSVTEYPTLADAENAFEILRLALEPAEVHDASHKHLHPSFADKPPASYDPPLTEGELDHYVDDEAYAPIILRDESDRANHDLYSL